MSYEMVGGLVGIVGAMSILGTWMWKIAKDGSDQRGRIYDRMDDEREAMQRNYRSEAVCDERHEGLQIQLKTMGDDIKTISTDVKRLILKNGLSHDD